jgi:malonate transporter MadL subunit
MIIYGVAILAFCYIAGQLTGELVGHWLGVGANVGGVGFAMLLLILGNDWLARKGYSDPLTNRGIDFWSQLYIPIVVAMSAVQNVKVAVSSGAIALLAGIVPVLLCVACIPLLAKLTNAQRATTHVDIEPVSR